MQNRRKSELIQRVPGSRSVREPRLVIVGDNSDGKELITMNWDFYLCLWGVFVYLSYWPLFEIINNNLGFQKLC